MEGKPITYMSVCSGVEAASVAWEPLGWRPYAFAEIEPFPCAVLRARWPGVPNLGDLNKISVDEQGGIHYGADSVVPGDGTVIDALVGGTPCQSWSSAGKGAGLRGVSGLALEYVRLAYELAAHRGLRWVLWENVPNILTSRHAGDFAAFLSGLAGRDVDTPRDGWGNAGCVEQGGSGNFGLAYRVLDVQFTRVSGFPKAVPQRRRRLFVVGRLGDWERAAGVLFERSGLSRRDPPGRGKGQGLPAGA